MAITAFNLAGSQAARNLNFATSLFELASRRLSSGLRVEYAADGPADFAKAQKLEARRRSLARLEIDQQESRSLLQTGNSGIDSIITNLQTIREYAVSSASASSTTAERSANHTSYQSLRDEITSVSNTTTYNGKSLLDGTYRAAGGDDLIFQTGADAASNFTLNIEDIDATALGVNALNLATQAGGSAALTVIDAAIAEAQTEQSKISAADERLEASLLNVQTQQTAHENAIAAITGADFAQETVNYARSQLIQQSAAAALAQANFFPQNVLAAILPARG